MRLAVLRIINGPGPPPSGTQALLDVLDRADRVDKTPATAYDGPRQLTVLAYAVEAAHLLTAAETLAEVSALAGRRTAPPHMDDLVFLADRAQADDDDRKRIETARRQADERLRRMYSGAFSWVLTAGRTTGASREWKARSVGGTRAPDDTWPVPPPAGTPLDEWHDWTDRAVRERTLAEVHADWSTVEPDQQPEHPFLPFVEAWISDRAPRAPRRPSGRMDPVLPRVMVEEPPQPATEAAMPMVPAGRHSVRPAVLELVDAHGAPFRSRGRGATLESALLIEACFDLEAHATGLSSATLDWTVGGLCKALFPAARGRGGRAETWRRTAEALCRLDGAAVPYTQRSGRVDRFKVWSSVLVPGDDAHDTDRVFVTINLPLGTGTGPILDREAVRRARLASSVAWRALIGVASCTWIKGITRIPLPRGRGGLWSGRAEAYPVLSADDRRRIAFGAGDTRPQCRVDQAWRDQESVVVIDESAVQKDGKTGWRVVLPETAAALKRSEE